MELDLRLGGGDSAAGAQKVERVTFRLLELVGDREPEAIIPVLDLRCDIAEEFRARGELHLAGASARVASRGALLYAQWSRSSDARPLSAAVLSVLGSSAQTRYALVDARDLFGAALSLDPASEAALLGLGVNEEILGRYEVAAAFFSRWHAACPDRAEAALRLGVNLARLKRHGPALEKLEAACSATEPWVALVACQEHARVLLGAGRERTAVTVLEAARRRFPDDAALLAELVLALDRSGRPQQALELAGELRASPGQPSARLLYARWPVHAAGRARATLASAAAARLELLARVLALTASGG